MEDGLTRESGGLLDSLALFLSAVCRSVRSSVSSLPVLSELRPSDVPGKAPLCLLGRTRTACAGGRARGGGHFTFTSVAHSTIAPFEIARAGQVKWREAGRDTKGVGGQVY